MQSLKIGRSTYTLSPTRNVGELQSLFSKCTGKSKQTKIKPEKRVFPYFTPGMSTREYVTAYYRINELENPVFIFEPLNAEPCALYTGEDLHETIADEIGAMPEIIETDPAEAIQIAGLRADIARLESILDNLQRRAANDPQESQALAA